MTTPSDGAARAVSGTPVAHRRSVGSTPDGAASSRVDEVSDRVARCTNEVVATRRCPVHGLVDRRRRVSHAGPRGRIEQHGAERPRHTVVAGPRRAPGHRDPRPRPGRPRRPAAQPRDGVHHGGTRPPRPARTAAVGRWRPSSSRWPAATSSSWPRVRRREVGVPDPAPRQQRGAVLPAGRRARARDAADRLHPDRRYGDRGVQPPVPPPRGVFLNIEDIDGIDRAWTPPDSDRRRRPGRRLRRRGDPRHRRLGRRRDRHLDRQARRLHGRRRDRPAPGAGRRARRGHEPGTAAERPALPGTAPLPGPGRGVRRVHRRLRGQRLGSTSRRRSCTGRTSPARRRGGILARYGDTLCTFDDDIQGTAAVGTGLRTGRRAGLGRAPRSTSRSSSSVPARPESGSPT